MLAPLSLTIISSFQTAWYNNQALSMNPFGLQFPERRKFLFPPLGARTDFFCDDPDKYLNMSNVYNNMSSDETEGQSDNEHGEYLDMRNWELLDIQRKTDSRGRIHVNEVNYNKDIRVFVSDINKELETCKHYFLLPHSTYIEIRKTRGKNNIGDPLKVQKNGDVWTTQKNKYVKIFVKVL